MTDKRIKSYLEDRLKRLESIRNEREWTTAELGDIACCKQILAFINSLQEEPVSEDLDSFAIKYAQDKPYPVTVCQAVKVGANWQFEQLMAKAVDAVVKIDAGGYPYVDRTIELYDYDKDIPLAKRGDKVKILVIKES